MPETVLSSSSVAAYRSCGYRFYLQYVEMHEGVSSMQSAVGTAVHAGAEAYYRGWLDPESAISEEDLRAEAMESADLTYLLEAGAVVDSDEDPVKVRAVVGRVMTSYLEDVAVSIRSSVLGVEQEFRFTVNGIEYSGHIDQLENSSVRDTKVLGQRPRFPDKYLFGMTGYAMGARELTGTWLRMILDVMIRLKRDRPRYEQIDLGDVTQRRARDFVRQLTDAANGIARGKFEPTGLATGECRYCPVRTVCDPYLESGQ